MLTRGYPEASVTSAVQPLSADDFAAQKLKHLSRGALGGAVGVITTPEGRILLARRTKMHAGWSLVGGTVEQGEDFAEAFRREVKEEVGVEARDVELVQIEQKRFVSPADEQLDFILAVFLARIAESALPPPTQEALDEGLTIALFDRTALPDPMIMADREKIELLARRRIGA